MTNSEYFEKEVKTMCNTGKSFAVTKDNKIIDCMSIDCFDCIFFKDYANQCSSMKILWLYEDYQSNLFWKDVPIDTPVRITDGKIKFAHFAGVDSLGRVQVFSDGKTSHTNGNCCYEVYDMDKVEIQKIFVSDSIFYQKLEDFKLR